MFAPALLLAAFSLLLAAALWPRRGLVARLRRARRLDERIRLEDALKHVYACQRRGVPCTVESLAGQLGMITAGAASVLERLTEMGLVRGDLQGPSLTAEGRESALRIVRVHRLWERYLADRTAIPAAEWHGEAERVEHTLSAEEAEALSARLGHPRWDPHGDPIPTASGEVPPPRGASLLAAEPGTTVEVVHLEDEPRPVYESLLDEGLAPGDRLEVVARSERGVRVRRRGRPATIGAVAARNVTVRPLPPGEAVPGPCRTLADVGRGESVSVVGLAAGCRGAQRRRLLDLGVVRGTEVTPELVSAAGDPVAYRIRGALIALRREQASWVEVKALGDDDREVA